jgi:integrase
MVADKSPRSSSELFPNSNGVSTFPAGGGENDHSNQGGGDLGAQATFALTRTPGTEKAYLRRYTQLQRTLATELGRLPTPEVFVDFLLRKRATVKKSSWRQIRAACCYGLACDATKVPQHAPRLNKAIEGLKQAPHPKLEPQEPQEPKQPRRQPLRTSAKKAKRCSDEDLKRICHATLATTSPNRKALVDLLISGRLTGLRPSEWGQARLQPSTVPGYEWELVVKCAKNTNGRAPGLFRTLRWRKINQVTLSHLQDWVELAGAAQAKNELTTLVDTLRDLMANVIARTQLFPRRQKWPTPYTLRHEVAAHWKAAYLANATTPEERVAALAKVAALLGHVACTRFPGHRV